MTCIVGIVDAGRVLIAGDSAGSDGWHVDSRADSKVFTVGPYAMGFTTSFRMGQLLRYRLDVPGPDTWDVDRYMATTFVDAVRDCLKAGGFGLNLTQADYCFVLDPWWNPAAETQAVDRAHRIGQSSTVVVYRYVSTGTIEEKVMELKERKAALFSSVMDADDALSGALGADDIRALIDLPAAG